MIYQIETIKTKTSELPKINRGLIQARRIQARLHDIVQSSHVADGILGSFQTSTAFQAPISRWAE